MKAMWNTGLGKIRHLSPWGKHMIVASSSGKWSVFSLEGKVSLEVQAHARSCYWAIAHPNKEGVVLSGGQDGELTAHQGKEEIMRLAVHQSAVYRGLVQNEVLWTAGRDKEAKAWSLNNLESLGKLPLPHTRSINALALGGTDNKLLGTGSDEEASSSGPQRKALQTSEFLSAVWQQRPRAHQTIGVWPQATRASFAFVNGRLPQKPL